MELVLRAAMEGKEIEKLRRRATMTKSSYEDLGRATSYKSYDSYELQELRVTRATRATRITYYKSYYDYKLQ